MGPFSCCFFFFSYFLPCWRSFSPHAACSGCFFLFFRICRVGVAFSPHTHAVCTQIVLSATQALAAAATLPPWPIRGRPCARPIRGGSVDLSHTLPPWPIRGRPSVRPVRGGSVGRSICHIFFLPRLLLVCAEQERGRVRGCSCRLYDGMHGVPFSLVAYQHLAVYFIPWNTLPYDNSER